MKPLVWSAIFLFATAALVTLNSCSSSGTTSSASCPGAGCPPPSQSPFWGQWGSNPQHTGMVSVAGQSLANKIVDIVYDPFVTQEKAENAKLFGEPVLTVHEQTPITDGDDVYMVMKMGSYTSCPTAGDWTKGTACGPNAWNTMEWCESRFSWVKGQLVQVWSFSSDWVPEPNAANFPSGFGGLDGWEPVFHPADANNFLYVPGAAGSVWKVDKAKGTSVSQIKPFAAVNGADATNTFVSGPLTADSSGNIYYNVIELNVTGNPWNQNDVANSWLVKVAPDDSFTTVTYSTLVPGAPAATSTNCPGTFFNLGDGGASAPWPPTPAAVPPTQLCGSQRPGVNLAPAVASDGTIYTGSVAHFDNMVSYLVAVNPDLTPKWASSLQLRLNDGCGVLLPIGSPVANSCAAGTTVGVDPTTNAPGSGEISDLASSSPTVLPDGSVVLGVVDNYNFSRGHLFHFDAAGNYLNAFTFGWDSTPAAYSHGGTFSVVIKDNHYDSAAYCNFLGNPVCVAAAPGPYYISQLDANLNIEWSFQSTTTDADHPNGYEWCINMPAIDMNGNVFVNSEDGNIYELPQGNNGVFTTSTGNLFLNQALGAAYTPLSVGADGRLYTQNNGHLFVVGN